MIGSGDFRTRRGSAILIVAVLVAACTAPVPPPTPTASATPSPTASGSPTTAPTPLPTASPMEPPRHALDGEVDLAGVRHDSRDLAYRTPGGAVPAGTPVTLRLRTFRNDVDSVQLRLFSLNSQAEALLDMSLEADAVSCYEESLDAAGDLCDWWAATLDNSASDNIWYRFIVGDGERRVYYADDTAALDGGVGRATPAQIDQSYALTVYEPGFAAPEWAREAVVYQIFPDRFRNGDPSNDPQIGDVRYDDPVLALEWDELPEGHCRGYAGVSAESCPWRFDDSPPSWSPDVEGPRGRDYYGGDLAGVIEQLPYLESLGVTAIYFNPIFDAGSNHGYDTQDYERIEPYFGTNREFEELVSAARGRGIRIILDGVFNHTSSDSPWFDRYGHYDTLGACEAVDSEWRPWYYMTNQRGPCVGEDGEGDANYQSWFGFDTLPIMLKNQPQLREYFLSAPDSITRRWIARGPGGGGADGWRMDVSGDPSFPRDYWSDFRAAVRAANPDALTISETWQKDSALLRNVRGDRFDTTMNYRLRDAVLGLLAPHGFDAKGFPDSGRQLTATEFAARMLSQQEDYAPATYYSLMNLLDSHDTERVLWTLTPGTENRDGRELDAANLAEGKARLRLASLIQFTVPGMPTIYYGDEVGLTGDDDPDDRRTYPWADLGGEPDTELLSHYQALAQLRRDVPALIDGELSVPYVNDEEGTFALARRNESQAVVIAINTSTETRTLRIPTGGLAPDRVLGSFGSVWGDGTGATMDGALEVELPAMAGRVLATDPSADLQAPEAPTGLRVSGLGDGYLELVWEPSGNAGYNVYRSPLAGGGWVLINDAPLSEPLFRDEGLENGRLQHYVVTTIDNAGNESGYSSEVAETPRLAIEGADLVGPEQRFHVISATTPTEEVCAAATLAGGPGSDGPPSSLRAELSFGPAGGPVGLIGWAHWLPVSYAGSTGDGHRYCGSLLPDATGAFDYAFRFSTSNGREWTETRTGSLVVTAADDTTPPATPAGLRVVSATPFSIELAWDAVGDEDLFAYEVRRYGGPELMLDTKERTTDTSFVHSNVVEGSTYVYEVLAFDEAFNFSPPTPQLEATAARRLVSVVFSVTVPQPTGDAVGQSVHIAGTLSALEGDMGDWDPAATPLEQVDETTWTITLQGVEGSELDYKYTLGSWDYVEKDGSCGELANRTLIVSFDEGIEQQVADEVSNWRNVEPCGN